MPGSFAMIANASELTPRNMRCRRLATGLVLSAILLAGCAGFRGGWESVPYVGETPQDLDGARTAYEAQKRSELTLPGMTLGVSIHNRLRTYDTQIYLFVLPLSIDPRNVSTQTIEPGKTRISLRISKLTDDLLFRPKLARLTVGDQTVQATSSTEFAMWNAQGEKVSTGGNWDHRPLADETRLIVQEKAYIVNLDFPVPTPSPESKALILDLSSALTSDKLPTLPPIRFVPVRWKEGYT